MGHVGGAPPPSPIIVACGLRGEARLFAGGEVRAVAGGGDGARLEAMLEEAVAAGARAILSAGLCGALAPTLRPGVLVIGDAVVAGTERIAADPPWTMRLAAALPLAVPGEVLGSDTAITAPQAKADLFRQTHTLAVDMESQVAARVAARHGLPFAILRAVCDPAERSVPAAAVRAMRPDGSTDVAAVLGAVLRDPALLSALLRLAQDSRKALAALGRARRLLGPRLGLDF